MANYGPVSNLPFLGGGWRESSRIPWMTHLSLTYVNLVSGLGFDTQLYWYLVMLDRLYSSLLILLDFSAAFEEVNHSIVIHQFEYGVGIKQPFGDFTLFCLTRLRVSIGGVESTGYNLSCFVPQGSVFLPTYFCTRPLSEIIWSFSVGCHHYTNDPQY